jgi:glycolate oxidase FAD binding subunit
VAVNAAGPRRYGYGTIRDYVLGFTAVDGTGALFSGGGRVVKNAAGYNMARLMTGSLGTLGILTQITLMVRPFAEASALLVCDLPQLDAAEQFLSGLVHSATRPVAIELLAGQPRNDDGLLGPAVEGSAGRLCIGFEGPAGEVEWMVGQLRQEWNAAGIRAPRQLSGSDSDAVWQQLTETPADAEIGIEIHVLPSATVAVIAKLLALVPESIVQAHAGNGVICVGLPCSLAVGRRDGESNADGKSTAMAVVRQLREIAAAAGGKLIVTQHPDTAQLSAADIWGPPGPAAGVMQAVKDRFDPQNILNPGRFVFA